MATADPMPDVTAAASPAGGGLLVMLTAMPEDQLDPAMDKLASAFPGESLVVATPDGFQGSAQPDFQIVSAPAASPSWALTAADFDHAHQLAQKHDARAILVLGQEAGSLSSEALRDLAQAVLGSGIDLAIPRYELPPHASLVNSAILYPLTRALFASRARFPLAIDLGLSPRMAERLGSVAHRFTSISQGDALLWPVNEAAVSGCAICEVDAGPRTLPRPTDPSINAILPLVAGSLFADIDAKAAFWQRPRQSPPARGAMPQAAAAEDPADIAPMLDAFHLAYTNLQEIWSLVLPPNSLLGLKRLSVVDAAAFRMPDSLWARVVFDFLIAYRLRTINRGHLLGALIPLYLGWAASHLNISASGTSPERHVEAVAAAFEAEKPYLVSRWRWPDRFNP